MHSRRQRRQHGSFVALAFVALIPLVAAIGGFAVDCMHFNDERGALQRATDAAALAGAEDLASYKTSGGLNSTASVQGPGNQEPVNFALAVAKVNVVDGRPLVTDTTNNTVTVTANLTDPDPKTGNPDSCEVTGQMQIRSLFSMLFGNFGQTVNTYSKASATTMVDTIYQGGAYPLVLGFNDLQPGGGPALGTLTQGSTFTYQIGTNAKWLLGNASAVSNAQNAYVNKTGSGGTPTLQIGQNLSPSNGVMGGCESALGTLPAGTMLICPIVDSVNGNTTCVGFAAIQTGAPSPGPWGGAVFNGTLVASGTSLVTVGATAGIPINATYSTFLNNNKVVAVHLVK